MLQNSVNQVMYTPLIPLKFEMNMIQHLSLALSLHTLKVTSVWCQWSVMAGSTGVCMATFLENMPQSTVFKTLGIFQQCSVLTPAPLHLLDTTRLNP